MGPVRYLTLLFLGLLLAPAALGYTPYADQLVQDYASGANCAVCHRDGKLNPYGVDFKKALTEAGDLVSAFNRIQVLDSDGDGIVNDRELAVGSYPGDPFSRPGR